MPPKKKTTRALTEQETEEVTEADDFAEEMRSASSLADIAGTGGGAFEGELTKLEGIEDEEVHVLDFRLAPSKFSDGNYVAFQARTLEGKLIVVMTSTGVPVDAFEKADKEQLPFCAVFFRQRSKAGNLYWNIKNPETPCLM